MAGIVNTSLIQDLLRPGLAAVWANYNSYPHLWKSIFKQFKSDKAVEYEVEMQSLGTAIQKMEGAPTQMQTMKEAFKASYQHVYYSVGTVLTRQAIVDNLYKDQFPAMSIAMKSSLTQAKDIAGANVLNLGFSGAGPDGQPLFSTTHPLTTGVGQNTFSVATQLSESAIQDAWALIQLFQSVSGILTPTRMKKLVVPPALEFMASILLGSKYRTGTGNNDINPITHIDGGLLPEGYVVNPYLTSPTAWFIQTDADNGLKMYQREDVFFMMQTDTLTQNLITTATERYSFGYSDWRGAFGSQGM